jgi:hypothetical protein
MAPKAPVANSGGKQRQYIAITPWESLIPNHLRVVAIIEILEVITPVMIWLVEKTLLQCQGDARCGADSKSFLPSPREVIYSLAQGDPLF